jgi:CubicO group peptidase (beta-lactamase class C family)
MERQITRVVLVLLMCAAVTAAAQERVVDAGPGQRESGSFPSPPITGSMSNDDLSRALDGYLSRLAQDDRFSGVALVARNGERVFEKAYGFADRANRIPNTPATRFNLGSINKIFTQTAIEQLIAGGKLARSDTLGRLMPDYPQEITRAATIDQLLRHGAGIADLFGDEFARTSKDRFRRNADYFSFVSKQQPLFAPGERNQYCNGCYITLGAIVEKVAGMSYEEYVADKIYKPAGMTQSAPLQTDAIEPNVAMGYTRRGGGDLRSNMLTRGASGSAAGGGYATAADLLAFDIAMKQGKLLEPGRVAEFYGARGLAGGAPGISAVLHSSPTWTVIVLANLDPPAGEAVGTAIARALTQ